MLTFIISDVFWFFLLSALLCFLDFTFLGPELLVYMCSIDYRVKIQQKIRPIQLRTVSDSSQEPMVWKDCMLRQVQCGITSPFLATRIDKPEAVYGSIKFSRSFIQKHHHLIKHIVHTFLNTCFKYAAGNLIDAL